MAGPCKECIYFVPHTPEEKKAFLGMVAGMAEKKPRGDKETRELEKQTASLSCS